MFGESKEEQEKEKMAFHLRETERGTIRQEIEQVLTFLTQLDEILARFTISGPEERLCMARAKIEVLQCLQRIEAASQAKNEVLTRGMLNSIEKLNRKKET